jgi:Cysteine rich repeat
MPNRYWLLLLTSAMIVATLSPAWAQTSATPPRPRQACAADVKQFCGDVQPGGGRLVQCMRDNAAKLSSGCRDALQAAQAERASKAQKSN